MSGQALVLRGDARALPLPDASVDLIVTSPPYFALRSYQDGGQHYGGQIGAESTPGEYLDNLIACTREWMRVLRPTGSLMINLGDKYSTYEGPRSIPQHSELGRRQNAASQVESTRHVKSAPLAYGIPYKSLFGLPWRYALRCIDELGLILRAELIWSKPNGLPESVTDRVRRSHEQWFHFTRQQRYYSAVDAIRQPHAPDRNHGRNALAGQKTIRPVGPNSGAYHTLGALPTSVWEIATEPLTVAAHLEVDHFAAFPTEWPRRLILGWSPSGWCTECGEARRPAVVCGELREASGHPTRYIPGAGRHPLARHGEPGSTLRLARPGAILGECCACPEPTAPTRPSVVLDPFSGTGTTALVAAALGRIGIGVDRSGDYCRIGQWRTTDRGQLAKALGVPKPPAQLDGQTALFDEGVA